MSAAVSCQAECAKRGNSIKFDDVSLTIFAWDNIPVTIYHQGSTAASCGYPRLLRIQTDEGLEGHAFLGSVSNPASMDAAQPIR